MKKLVLFVLLFTISCKKEIHYSNEIFWLKSRDSNMKILNDSLQLNFQKGIIRKNPLIVINGEIYNYDSKSDTITLPFNKNEISSFNFLRKEISIKLYNDEGKSGIILIATKK